MGRRTKREKTRVFIVQDKSGSMGSRRAETISGFNEYIDALEGEENGDIFLSLIQFDTNVKEIFLNRHIDDVDPLKDSDFVPSGMTALRDGVGRAISRAEATVRDADKVLIVIMTDGGENSSHEYSQDAILKQIGDKRADGWEFVFLGAGEEAWNAGNAVFGNTIPESHKINYGTMDSADHVAVYSMLASSTSNVLRGGNSAFNPALKSKLEDKAKKEKVGR